ncbi:glycosyltransferase family 4 protein [Enterobacteriaceae bacterium H11S18]|uniref:glycosyltransferase family 4 protein n=1 Tax=Dryocola clanedunensis TaxID=2925396 RepID=UPI0022F00ABD|nr:glycosyltransferase family 4 protein [Dryocola clanedunensis]MCT4712318.1 glycosyltransferase family 4 protein [Dryocola clanedunensis]
MKRVCILIWGLNSSAGTERVAVNIANGLSEYSNNTTVEIMAITGGNSFYKINEKVTTNLLNYDTGFFSYIKACLALKAEKYDSVIVVSMGKLSVFMTALKYIFRIKSKWILSEHISFSKYNSFEKKIKKIIYSLADKVILLTEHDKQIVSNGTDKFMVIENASPYEPVEEINESANKIIAIGRLTHQKGFDRLLNIWAEFCKKNKNGHVLEIYGEGELKDNLISQAKDAGILRDVRFCNAHSNIEEVYSETYCLMMTSRFEGLPMVLIEAKSFGVPVLSYNCKTGPEELISNGEDGFLIADGDSSAFLDKLSSILDSKVMRNEMAKKSLNNAKRFCNKEIALKWLAIIF